MLRLWAFPDGYRILKYLTKFARKSSPQKIFERGRTRAAFQIPLGLCREEYSGAPQRHPAQTPRRSALPATGKGNYARMKWRYPASIIIRWTFKSPSKKNVPLIDQTRLNQLMTPTSICRWSTNCQHRTIDFVSDFAYIDFTFISFMRILGNTRFCNVGLVKRPPFAIGLFLSRLVVKGNFKVIMFMFTVRWNFCRFSRSIQHVARAHAGTDSRNLDSFQCILGCKDDERIGQRRWRHGNGGIHTAVSGLHGCRSNIGRWRGTLWIKQWSPSERMRTGNR